MILTQDEFKEIFHKADVYDLLTKHMQTYMINTPLREAHFLAQAGYESLNFTMTTEFMDYSAKRIMAVFKSHFKTLKQAVKYEHQPQKLGNFVYADRFGNKDFQSGDGYAYRGRGFIPITFRDNYQKCGSLLSVDLLTNPQILAEIPYAAASACAWWQYKHLNLMADEGIKMVQSITRIVNGSTQDLPARQRLFDKIWQKVSKKDE